MGSQEDLAILQRGFGDQMHPARRPRLHPGFKDSNEFHEDRQDRLHRDRQTRGVLPRGDAQSGQLREVDT